MQRNTAQIEGKYYFLRDSQAVGRFATGPLEEATFTFIGRGVYDSVYDIRDAYSNLSGGAVESTIREAFIDFVMPPFTLRLGKQQVVWGETDNFRALDVINPLDLSWHWSRESWEDIRIPLWMAGGIYDIGKIGPFEESFFEVIWMPWDFEPNDVETDPRYPWGTVEAAVVVLMLAIDRPTWIRALNDQRTFFLSAQVFWRRYLDYSNFYRGISSVVPAKIGGEVIPGRFVSTNTDKWIRTSLFSPSLLPPPMARPGFGIRSSCSRMTRARPGRTTSCRWSTCFRSTSSFRPNSIFIGGKAATTSGPGSSATFGAAQAIVAMKLSLA